MIKKNLSYVRNRINILTSVNLFVNGLMGSIVKSKTTMDSDCILAEITDVVLHVHGEKESFSSQSFIFF